MLYIYQTGDEPQKQDTQANKRSPLLSEEVPYQITLIRLNKNKEVPKYLTSNNLRNACSFVFSVIPRIRKLRQSLYRVLRG